MLPIHGMDTCGNPEPAKAIRKLGFSGAFSRVVISAFIVVNLLTIAVVNLPHGFHAGVRSFVAENMSPAISHHAGHLDWNVRRYAHLVGLDNRWWTTAGKCSDVRAVLIGGTSFAVTMAIGRTQNWSCSLCPTRQGAHFGSEICLISKNESVEQLLVRTEFATFCCRMPHWPRYAIDDIVYRVGAKLASILRQQ